MTILFGILSVILIATSLGVILFRNPLHSALSLILNMISVAGFFALLNAHFLATVQIIVYAGAIMVLVIFVLMLLNMKVEERKRSGFVLLGIGAVVATCFLGYMLPLLQAAFSVFDTGAEVPAGNVETIGRILYTEYIFTFEAASVLIMAAIVGAVMLTTSKNEPRGQL